MTYGAAAGDDARGPFLDRHDRRLVENDPFARYADLRIGRAEIDGQVGT